MSYKIKNFIIYDDLYYIKESKNKLKNNKCIKNKDKCYECNYYWQEYIAKKKKNMVINIDLNII